jgi:hypothetical protein
VVASRRPNHNTYFFLSSKSFFIQIEVLSSAYFQLPTSNFCFERFIGQLQGSFSLHLKQVLLQRKPCHLALELFNPSSSQRIISRIASISEPPMALDTSDTLAVTSIVVALIALLSTIGQILQQYIGTSEGYRRCQPSVMGLWGRATR